MRTVVVVGIIAMLLFKDEVVSVVALTAIITAFVIWLFAKVTEHGNF